MKMVAGTNPRCWSAVEVHEAPEKRGLIARWSGKKMQQRYPETNYREKGVDHAENVPF